VDFTRKKNTMLRNLRKGQRVRTIPDEGTNGEITTYRGKPKKLFIDQ